MLNALTAANDEPLLKYDYVLRITYTYLSPVDAKLSNKIQKLLHQGLGDRARSIRSISHAHIASPEAGEQSLFYGLLVNEDNIARTIDRGPLPEQKDRSRLFREFWQDKAELRRFKDGTIQESAVWTSKTALDLCREIVTFVIRTHIKTISIRNVGFVGHDNAFAQRQQDSTGEPFDSRSSTFDSLQRTLRAMEGIPLAVHQIQTATFMAGIPMIPFVDVVLQFEASARWPDDLRAIQVTKMAFLLKLDELLHREVVGLTTRLGRENEHASIMNSSFLDLVYPNSAAFRIRIFHDREQTLLQRQLLNKSTPVSEREFTGSAWSEYKRTFIKRPMHAQSMSNLATRHSAMLPTLGLVRMWFNAHLLGAHFASELVELFVARTFTHLPDRQPPATALTGLLRVLSSLAQWDWHSEPWIVSFGNALDKAQVLEIRTRLEAWRKIDPMMNRVVLFAATSADQEGITWTEFRPSKVIAGRMTSLARASMQAVQAQALALKPETLFSSPTTDYDFVLRISKQFNGERSEKGQEARFKNLQKGKSVDAVNVDYLPSLEYAKELEKLYGETVIFFYSTGVCDTIAGIWRPHSDGRRWKLKMTYSSMQGRRTADNKLEVLVNKDAMLNEIVSLGGDMVSKVEVNR